MSKLLTFFSLILGILAPMVLFAQNFDTQTAAKDQGLVICGRDLNKDGMVKGPDEECDYSDIVWTIRVIIKYLLMVAGSLAAISFAYAGFLYLTAAGAEEKIKHAHEIFLKVAIGFVIILSAWLIVKTIERTLIDEQSGIPTYLVE